MKFFDEPPPGWLIALLLAMSVFTTTAAVIKTVRWLNQDNADQNKWEEKERNRKYKNLAGNVIGPFLLNTNVTVGLGSGTNRVRIEFGFRDDGVVVWRKAK